MNPVRNMIYAGVMVGTGLAMVGGAQAATSVSEITAEISFTLIDIKVDGATANSFTDYDPDGGVEVFSDGIEHFDLGGAGFTVGSSSTSIGGTMVDPDIGADPLEIGDTLTMMLHAQATATAGYVNLDQIEFAGFSFYNYTDNGSGGSKPLSFEFQYAVNYSTSLTNDVAGNQALVNLNTIIELDDGTDVTTLDLFPDGTVDAISELYNGLGTAAPGDARNGTFTLDLTESNGYFTFETTVSTPTYISTVPIPAALWLFGSGILGLTGLSRRGWKPSA